MLPSLDQARLSKMLPLHSIPDEKVLFRLSGEAGGQLYRFVQIAGIVGKGLLSVDICHHITGIPPRQRWTDHPIVATVTPSC